MQILANTYKQTVDQTLNNNNDWYIDYVICRKPLLQ